MVKLNIINSCVACGLVSHYHDRVTHMDAWAQRGSPVMAIWEDAVQLDAVMVGNGSRTCSVRQLPPGPSVIQEEDEGG